MHACTVNVYQAICKLKEPGCEPHLCVVNADVDECLVSNGGCNQTCMNTYGSHQCLCETGFTLSADNRNCDGTRT